MTQTQLSPVCLPIIGQFIEEPRDYYRLRSCSISFSGASDRFGVALHVYIERISSHHKRRILRITKQRTSKEQSVQANYFEVGGSSSACYGSSPFGSRTGLQLFGQPASAPTQPMPVNGKDMVSSGGGCSEQRDAPRLRRVFLANP